MEQIIQKEKTYLEPSYNDIDFGFGILKLELNYVLCKSNEALFMISGLLVQLLLQQPGQWGRIFI